MKSINFEDFEKDEFRADLTRLARSFQTCKRVVAITGAGISVSAGIPDFRSAGGLYEQVKLKYASNLESTTSTTSTSTATASPSPPTCPKLKGKDFFDASFFHSPTTRPLFFQFIAELKESCARAQPTPTHLALKGMAEEGRLMRWYTQNIDCLEERMGLACFTGLTTEAEEEDAEDDIPTQSITSSFKSKPSSKSKDPIVITLHGTLNQVTCTQCRTVRPLTEPILASFRGGRFQSCSQCQDHVAAREALGKRRIHRVGLLRPDIVLYNEPHPHGEVIADFVSADLNRVPGVLLVMGTSLKIAGLKRMIKDFAKAMRSGEQGEGDAVVVFVNKTPAGKGEWKGVFDYELIGECDGIMNKLLGDVMSKGAMSKGIEMAEKNSKSVGMVEKNTKSVEMVEKNTKSEIKTAVKTTVKDTVKITVKDTIKTTPIATTPITTTPSTTTPSTTTTAPSKKKPIIKKVNATSSTNPSPSTIISTSTTTPATSSIITSPDSPALSHAKSKLPISTSVSPLPPPSPLPPHRISDFFSPVKTVVTSGSGNGGKKQKKPLLTSNNRVLEEV